MQIATSETQWSSGIRRDITRTFSIYDREQIQTQEIAALQDALFRVLNAVAIGEDGYCQGMNFVVALLLVEGVDEATAYALFLYLLKERHLAQVRSAVCIG